MAENDDLVHARRKICLSRLEDSEILSVVQALSVKEEQDDICLLQLNPDILNCLTEGEVLTIRGDAEDSAVLCTKSKTYELREAETSNSLLLLPDLKWPETENIGKSDLKVERQNVAGIFHTYLEARPLKPSFKKLRALLEQSTYNGREYEDANVGDKHTIQSLLNTIQASEEELRKELFRMQVCTVGGFLRMLNFDYKFNTLCSIINVIESKSLPLDKIPMKSVLKELEEDLEPKEIVEQCFVWFTRETDAVGESGEKLYALDEDSVCRIYAEVLLRSAGRFNLQDFLSSWQISVPDGMTCDLKQLAGMALTDVSSKPETIFYFPPDNLPEDTRERLLNLFKIKEKWYYEEIVPYLEDRANSASDIKALLIRYARESRKDGRLMYSAKW